MSIKPGLHPGLSNEDYHADQDYLSSTALKRVLPTYTEPDNDAALAFGTLFHSVVLEPDSLDQYVIPDFDAIGLEAARSGGYKGDSPHMTKAWKEAVETERVALRAAGKTIVEQADWDKAHRMADQVHAHHTASSLLFGGEGVNEESAFWVDDNGLGHKARFDRRIPGAIVDLKSTSAKPLDRDGLSKATADYLYDLSAAHYLAVAEGLELDVNTFGLVFVSKHAPHHVVVADLDDTFLGDGRILRAQAIDRIVNGPRGLTTLTPPRWRRLDTLEMTA